MEIFLAATLIATVAVLVIDTKHKRHAYLCQQEATTQRH
jgi:hypothetical protein